MLLSSVIYKTQQNKIFWLITELFEGTFPSFFKDEKVMKSHKNVEIKVFLSIFA
jgi:hypothetical protein